MALVFSLNIFDIFTGMFSFHRIQNRLVDV